MQLSNRQVPTCYLAGHLEKDGDDAVVAAQLEVKDKGWAQGPCVGDLGDVYLGSGVKMTYPIR